MDVKFFKMAIVVVSMQYYASFTQFGQPHKWKIWSIRASPPRTIKLPHFPCKTIEVQSQSNKPKNTLGDRQNSIKTVILLDIFLWCQFNAMLIMERSAKWLIWMLKKLPKKIWVLVLIKKTFELEQHLYQKLLILQITKLKTLFTKEFWWEKNWDNVKWLSTFKNHSQFESCEI